MALAERMVGSWRDAWRGPAVRVRLNGSAIDLGAGKPMAEVVVHDAKRLCGLLWAPSLAFGQAYMDGGVEIQGDLLALLQGFYQTASAEKSRWRSLVIAALRSLPRPVGRRRAVANAQHHYDLGNDFYRLWLDESLAYSCAYFVTGAEDLATAQRQKIELLLRKLRLEPGQRLLDIGCGWGALMFHAVERFGIHATGVTPARQQADHIEREARRRGIQDRVHVIRSDWRDVDGRYDRVVSVGMFEHVGREQHRAFFRKWRDLLAPGGLSVLHTIGRMSPRPTDPWIGRYIFPGGYLPALTQLAHHGSAAGLRATDVENLRPHYALTLSHWSARFEACRDQVARMYDDRFVRMWRLYLLGSEAAFRWGDLQLWQIILDHGHNDAQPLNRELGIEPGFTSPEPQANLPADASCHRAPRVAGGVRDQVWSRLHQ